MLCGRSIHHEWGLIRYYGTQGNEKTSLTMAGRRGFVEADKGSVLLVFMNWGFMRSNGR